MAGGVVVVEFVFSFPGVGGALVDSVGNRDIPVVQALTLIIAAVYVVLGLISGAVMGELPAAIGWLGVAGLASGGLLYIAGAVIYASERPNPWPRVFGYHEVFHALVIAAAALHYAVIAFAVLPRG